MAAPFTDDQTRVLVNLQPQYAAWIAAERALSALPYDLRRKTVASRDYLYEINDRGGNGRSLGPWSAELQQRYDSYRTAKADAKMRREQAASAMAETGRLYRALRLPLLASGAAAILREADRRDLLGGALLVIGTNAMPAYLIEASGEIADSSIETEDFDLAWTGTVSGTGAEVWPMLQAVDPTYTVNTERPFQARNAAAYEVELLAAPSRMATLAQRDWPRPLLLPEQEWLLYGRPVDHVVVARDGSPARIVAPDPRWFALHKLWLSQQAKRDPLKRSKDRRQGTTLLDAVHLAMPQFPLDDAWEAGLPVELLPTYEDWRANRPGRPVPSW